MNKKLMKISGILFLIAGIGLMATVLFAGRHNNIPTASVFVALGIIYIALSTRKPSA
jgi:hypothetical protein